MRKVHQNIRRDTSVPRAPQHHAVSHTQLAHADSAPSCDFGLVIHAIDLAADIIFNRQRLPTNSSDQTYINAWT
jgi:hypothetical protein